MYQLQEAQCLNNLQLAITAERLRASSAINSLPSSYRLCPSVQQTHNPDCQTQTHTDFIKQAILPLKKKKKKNLLFSMKNNIFAGNLHYNHRPGILFYSKVKIFFERMIQNV